MFSAWSFRRRLVVTWLAIQSTITFGFTLAILESGSLYISESFDRFGTQLKPLVASALMAPMIQRDYASAQSIVEDILAKNTIAEFVLKDANGQTLLQRKQIADSSKTQSHRKVTDLFIAPITLENIKIGEACFSLDMSSYYDDQSKLLWSTSLISGASFLLFLIFSGLLSRQLTAPLLELTKKVKDYQNNRISIPKKRQSKDEVGLLYNAFAELTREVQQKIDSLNALNETLEERVAARTAEREALLGQIQEQQKFESLGTMVAGVAHEINNPLGIAITAATHLREMLAHINHELSKIDNPPESLTNLIEDQREAVELLTKNLKRSADLVKNFKEVAVDRNLSEFKAVELLEYTRAIISTLSPTLKKSNAQVTVTGQTRQPIKIDGGAYSQIISNLIINATVHAFKETENRRIVVEIEELDNLVAVHVSDNGQGIPSATLPTIFDPFVTTKRGQGGTGLGLYIARRVALDKFKGELTAANQSTGGARFTLSFPKS